MANSLIREPFQKKLELSTILGAENMEKESLTFEKSSILSYCNKLASTVKNSYEFFTHLSHS